MINDRNQHTALLRSGYRNLMRLLLVFAITLPLNARASGSIDQVRKLYASAPGSKASAGQLLELAQKLRTRDVVYRGYEGAARVLLASHAMYPLQKWNLFNEGKKILESAIAKAPENVELRYLRLTIQTNVPKFLGYSDDIGRDKTFVKQKLDKIDDEDLRKMIQSYLDRLNKT